MEVVRLFDPGAEPVDGGVAFGAGARLAGPVEVTPELANRAAIPPGYAFTTSDSGPFETWLVWGLARRYGGYANPPPPARDPYELFTVHVPRRPSPGEIVARLGSYVPGLAPQDDETLASPHSPIYLTCDGPAAPLLRPLALGPLRQAEDLQAYTVAVRQEPRPQLVAHAATAALELARGTGGIATDRDRFRVTTPVADVT